MKDQHRGISHEADIGSGEKGPGEQDTEKMIEQIGNSPGQQRPAPNEQQRAGQNPPSGGKQ